MTRRSRKPPEQPTFVTEFNRVFRDEIAHIRLAGPQAVTLMTDEMVTVTFDQRYIAILSSGGSGIHVPHTYDLLQGRTINELEKKIAEALNMYAAQEGERMDVRFVYDNQRKKRRSIAVEIQHVVTIFG